MYSIQICRRTTRSAFHHDGISDGTSAIRKWQQRQNQHRPSRSLNATLLCLQINTVLSFNGAAMPSIKITTFSTIPNSLSQPYKMPVVATTFPLHPCSLSSVILMSGTSNTQPARSSPICRSMSRGMRPSRCGRLPRTMAIHRICWREPCWSC